MRKLSLCKLYTSVTVLHECILARESMYSMYVCMNVCVHVPMYVCMCQNMDVRVCVFMCGQTRGRPLGPHTRLITIPFLPTIYIFPYINVRQSNNRIFSQP